jgi:hypothetical protein
VAGALIAPGDGRLPQPAASLWPGRPQNWS